MSSDCRDINETSRQWHAEQRRASQEIGPLPPVAHPNRRKRCEKSLLEFARTYFRRELIKPFSPAHLELITALEAAIKHGGQRAYAFPRSWGKTRLTEIATEWALLTGRSRYALVLTASRDLSGNFLQTVISDLTTNPAIVEDFPEVAVPIQRLENQARRCPGQLVGGKHTSIILQTDAIGLPYVDGFKGSGGVIETVSIVSQLRGKSRPIGGKAVRPDLIILDDIQDEEMAQSPERIRKSLALLNSTVLGLPDRSKKHAVFFLATVISPGDVADQILDHEKNPAWRGLRKPMLESLPTELDFWETNYRVVWQKGLLADDHGVAAAEFYRANRERLTAGAVPVWEAEFSEDEVDAVQHAMNLFLKNRSAFFSECQNRPLVDETRSARILLTATNLNGLPRGEVPAWASDIFIGVDVGKNLASYVCLAVDESDHLGVFDYGTFPRQPGQDFLYKNVTATWQTSSKSSDESLLQGLVAMLKMLLQPRKNPNGVELHPRGILVDCGWKPQIVARAIRLAQSGSILPCRGFAAPATSLQVSEWKARPGERLLGPTRIGQDPALGMRVATVGADDLKTRLAENASRLEIFGTDVRDHAMFFRHLASEYAIAAEARGRTVQTWNLVNRGEDNHLLDATAYAFAAAMVGGYLLPLATQQQTSKVQRKKLKIIQ